MPKEPAHDASIRRNDDGSLAYTLAAMKELLTRLVEKTGGYKHSEDAPYLIEPENEFSSPEHTFIPDAEMVARAANKDGLDDPYLTGLVAGEEITKVDPRQFTVFQDDKVEISEPELLAKGLRHYGGVKNGEPHMLDLVVFKPDRLALHWTAILTAFLVKTDVPMPSADARSNTYGAWVDARDDRYVQQVNEIYFKLFGIDRTLDHAFANQTPWEGAEERRAEITRICNEEKTRAGKVVEAYPNNDSSSDSYLSDEEKEKVSAAFKHTEDRNPELPPTTSRQLAEPWIAGEIYRDRIGRRLSATMEGWYRDLVFADNAYQKKAFVPEKEAETFVLSGGSATGKSLPMGLLTRELVKGIDAQSPTQWKHGLDLNDAVHMKSEVMRSLLVEPEFLNYGNRLFFDESAHVERAAIRKEMFHYMNRLLRGEAGHVAMGTDAKEPLHTPIMIHDRRSTYEHETDILLTNGRKLNYHYFNVPVEEALSRNRMRGAGDIMKFMDAEERGLPGGVPEGFDIATYAPRFVNARNNIGSHESSARRLMEMIETRAGENIQIPLYSTKVKFKDKPFVFGYADLKNREIVIQRLPRLIDMIDNTHYAIPPEHEHHLGPLPIRELGELARTSKKKAPTVQISQEIQDIENAHYAASWLLNLAKNHGYHVYVFTPPVERVTGRGNTQFLEIHPADANSADKTPLLTIDEPEVHHKLQHQPRTDKKHKHSTPKDDTDGVAPPEDTFSRYAAFLRELEHGSRTVERGDQAITTSRSIKQLLLNRELEAVEPRRFQPHHTSGATR